MAQLRQEVDPSEVGLDAKALDRLDQHLEKAAQPEAVAVIGARSGQVR